MALLFLQYFAVASDSSSARLNKATPPTDTESEAMSAK